VPPEQEVTASQELGERGEPGSGRAGPIAGTHVVIARPGVSRGEGGGPIRHVRAT